LVSQLVHPIKVAIVEALIWIDEPLSPKELDQVFDGQFGVSLVSYHMRKLADLGVVEKVHQQAVRGALQTFYGLNSREPSGSPRR
jgi:DNA-binding transcriptional regulator GbsR (MarR family)